MEEEKAAQTADGDQDAFASEPEEEKVAQTADSDQDSFASEPEEDFDTEEEDDFVPKSDCSDGSSSSDEGAQNGKDADDPADLGWKSRKGDILWSPTHEETLPYLPAKCVAPGPTRYATSKITDVMSCFDLFITEEITKIVMDMTNLEGKRLGRNWKVLDATELRAFIGLLLLAGVYKSRNEITASLWDEHNGRPIFRATMSSKQFRLINRMMRFYDKQKQRVRHKNDKLAPFRDIWDKWTARLPLMFNPGRDVCVDEQLVRYKGRCAFRQYMPKKPGKYGIKIWVTCDVATSYAWKMQIYTGKAADSPPEVNQGKRVVLEMTTGLKERTVTCDNFFTSHSLAEELLGRKMALVGTIRKSKPELPPKLLQISNREPLSSLFAFTKTHTAVSYVPKRGKNVVLLSTQHREPSVSDAEKKKPTIIMYYNHCKGGVDNLDKVVRIYSCKRKNSRWPQVLFFNMLDVTVYNAYVLWTAVNPSWNKGKSFRRRLFIEELGKMLVMPQMVRRPRMPRTHAAAAMVGALQGLGPVESDDLATGRKRKFCEYCCAPKKRRVCNNCSSCGKFVCKTHLASYCNHCCR